MIIVDLIHEGVVSLSLAMPIIIFIALIVSFASAPSGRRVQVLYYLLFGICVGLLGAHLIQPIQSGGWNWQFIFYPFLFAKWVFIGFMSAWSFRVLTDPDRRRSKLVFAGIIFTFALIPTFVDNS